jgi:hypothetical protein
MRLFRTHKNIRKVLLDENEYLQTRVREIEAELHQARTMLDIQSRNLSQIKTLAQNGLYGGKPPPEKDDRFFNVDPISSPFTQAVEEIVLPLPEPGH